MPDNQSPGRTPAARATSTYRRILFGFADDEASDAAIPTVAAFARQWSAYVRVLHVHRLPDREGNGYSRRLVKRALERFESEGVKASGEVRLVHRREEVAAAVAHAAKGEEVDLLALGSRGHSDLGGVFLGSVSHRVAAGLDLPVLVVRTCPDVHPLPRRVLVAVDGSEASYRAVAESGDVAKRTGASVCVLHVRPVLVAAGAGYVEPEDEGQVIVDSALASLRERGVTAEGRSVVTLDGIVEAIAAGAEAEQADLVVLASRRPSDLNGLLLGSVAHGVIHRLSRPVLLASRPPARHRVH